MKHREFWTKVWTLHESMDPGGDIIPRGAKFWLQPMSIDGEILYYELCFDQGIGECLRGMKLYPVGATRMDCGDPLPAYDDNDNGVKSQYHDRAIQVRSTGRGHPWFKRLEGTFKRDTDKGLERLIARIYCLAQGEANGHDWFVFDIILCPDVAPIEHLKVTPFLNKEDGVGHGDN